MKKLNYIDLFSGCGGLSDGFEKSKKYNLLAAVEWEKAPLLTLQNRLVQKYNIKDADKKCLLYDIQRTDKLIHGWEKDNDYESNEGLNKIIGKKNVNIIIGGPPCQAYSIAGRVRDENGMHDDYRNFLFESYIKIVKNYKPELFIFENVPGILSAKPGGIKITERIKNDFMEIGYEIVSDLKKYALIKANEYGVPQKRDRVIILGIKKDKLGKDNICEEVLKEFYLEILPKYKEKEKTVKEAIGDLEKFYPLEVEEKKDGRKFSHFPYDSSKKDHSPRFHNKRDIEIFKKLALDIENKENLFLNTEKLKEFYTEMTGKQSNIHKYYVLRWESQSNTIVAHLHKDGLRHIHPDYKQARSITVREAARLQTFDDDYEFTGSRSSNYKMIGNAVPPLLSKKLALAVNDLYKKIL